MPVDEHRIEQALEAAAPAVDTGRVLERVATKRARRRTARRIEGGVVALVVVAVVGLTAVLTTRDDGSSPQIAAPGASLSARVVNPGAAVDGNAGRVESPTPVDLDRDPGDLRGPLVVGSAALSLASYDRSESGLKLSHVVRVDGTHVVDVVDFKAEVISITVGEGARWALTRNLSATGGAVPDTFLKRIPADGIPQSTPLPIDSEPVGPVAAVGGAVWVPTRAGLLQFDTNGTLVRSIRLDPADTRSVAVIGKASAWVTDGAAGLRRLDPAVGATSDTRSFGKLPVRSAAGDGVDGWVLSGPSQVTFVGPDLRATDEITLPAGFTGSTITVGDGRAWVTGTVDGEPAIVLIVGHRAFSTVILRNSQDATLVWSAQHTVTAVSNGELVRFPLP